MELINIRNVGDHAFTLHHDMYGKNHFPPGAERVVPIQVALVSFGDPKLKGEEREIAYRMARQMFGFYEGITPESSWTDEVDNPNDAPGTKIGPLGPKYEAFDLDDNQVRFVLDDRYGDAGTTITTTGFSAQDQIDNLQRQLDILSKQHAALLNQSTVLPQQEIEMPEATDPEPAADDDDQGTKGTEPAPAKKTTAAKVPAAKKAADAPKPAARPVGKDKPGTSPSGR